MSAPRPPGTTGTAPSPARSTWRATRRAMLVGSGATVGLAVGFALWPRAVQLNLAAAPGETILNAWLKIGGDGRVTVLVPQAEMGQGVYTALPQILADELGADWRTVAVEPAPLNPVYANQLLLTPAADAVPGPVRGVARWALMELAERFDLQATVGSSSVAAYFAPLQAAGAVARDLLCRAAAGRLGVDPGACDTADGFVIHQANRLPFAELAAEAARLAELEREPESLQPELRADDRRPLLGKPLPRLDVPAKVDGRARFGADIRLPGLVYAAVDQGPAGATRLVSLSEPGPETEDGLVGIVRHARWVAVAARTWWQASRALERLQPRFELALLPDDDQDLQSRLDRAVADGRPDVSLAEGDPDVGASAGSALEAGYGAPLASHAALEPMTATARVTPEQVEVWAPTQSTRLARWSVARALGRDERSVRIYPTFVGGSFGRKLEPDACVQAAIIADRLGRPVQLLWSRRQDFEHDRFRPAAVGVMRARLGPDRRIASWTSRVAGAAVGPALLDRLGLDATILAPALVRERRVFDGLGPAPYSVPAYRLEHVETPLGVPVGLWRSGEDASNVFFRESFMDELAEAAQLDPLSFRLQHLAEAPLVSATLRAAASRAGFGEGAVPQGLAVHAAQGSVAAVVADMAIVDGVPVIRRIVAAVDCGTVVNPAIVQSQVEGGLLYALGAASSSVRLRDGRLATADFDSYRLPLLRDTPPIEVVILPSRRKPGGVSDLAVPPLAPALANAFYAATGVRKRSLPLFERNLPPARGSAAGSTPGTDPGPGTSAVPVAPQ